MFLYEYKLVIFSTFFQKKLLTSIFLIILVAMVLRHSFPDVDFFPPVQYGVGKVRLC